MGSDVTLGVLEAVGRELVTEPAGTIGVEEEICVALVLVLAAEEIMGLEGDAVGIVERTVSIFAAPR